MALNPPVSPNGMPAPVNGEYMVLVRKHIEAEITLQNKTKYKGKGNLYLTTIRLVFINDKPNSMMSFDIPIDLVTHEKFNQPIFGANYISGTVQPLYGLIPCPAIFKFWFMSGGTGTFLPMFYNIVEQIRRRRASGNHGPDPRFVECVAAGNLQNVAYVDPNDPSVIFLQQPQSPQPPSNNVGYYFPAPGATQPPPPVYNPYPILEHAPPGPYGPSNPYIAPSNNPPPNNYPPSNYPPAPSNYPLNNYPPPENVGGYPYLNPPEPRNH